MHSTRLCTHNFPFHDVVRHKECSLNCPFCKILNQNLNESSSQILEDRARTGNTLQEKFEGETVQLLGDVHEESLRLSQHWSHMTNVGK